MTMPVVRKNISEIDYPPTRSVAYGEVEYDVGRCLGPRIQQDLQLVMLDRGSVRITSDGSEQRVDPGQVVCQWPGGREFYRFDEATKSAHRWIAIEFEDSETSRRWLAEARALTPRVCEETPVMRRLFDAGFDVMPADDPAVGAIRTHLALAYLSAYRSRRGGDTSRSGTALPPALLAMQEAIAQHYAEPLALDDLAEAASVSTNHLVRLCRKHLNTTPMRMLWDRRAQHGYELIRHTGLTISEIAYRVGFANPFHFSRLFKARFGRSPRDFRNQQWGG